MTATDTNDTSQAIITRIRDCQKDDSPSMREENLMLARAPNTTDFCDYNVNNNENARWSDIDCRSSDLERDVMISMWVLFFASCVVCLSAIGVFCAFLLLQVFDHMFSEHPQDTSMATISPSQKDEKSKEDA
eukprot:TRINITY_DN21809_c0_g1_i1.p1 TRINITY_DN21809_c0_g1~~TRINITY_DN21809_c0_g1_i1.p1  ORF type:complete len:132 (-),score=19.72 TRINITY_DN21809_c0_g1_i1:26-421(-)